MEKNIDEGFLEPHDIVPETYCEFLFQAAGSFGSREKGESSVGGTVVVHSWGPLCSLTLLIALVAPCKFVRLLAP